MDTVVLCAGRINYELLPIATSVSHAMIPIAGRPAISWIVDDLIAKGIDDQIVIVHRADDAVLVDFVTHVYRRHAGIRLAARQTRGSILDSLASGMEHCEDDVGGVRVVLADSLIRDTFAIDGDALYAVPTTNPGRWCVVETARGVAVDYIEKDRSLRGPRLALAGYYQFRDSNLLRRSLAQAIDQERRQLSDVLRIYGAVHPFQVHEAASFLKFGHVEDVAAARRELISCRSFNRVSVDPVLGTITKTSPKVDKLRDELTWYRELPPLLQALTPRVLDWEDRGDTVSLTQEFYGYPTLAELYVCNNLRLDTWNDIVDHLLRVLERFAAYRGSLSTESIESMYLGKTRTRLGELAASGPWRELIDAPALELNGRMLRGLPELWPHIEVRCDQLARSAQVAIVHGDLCFSNVLFDMNTQIFRFIDPRGRFGEPGLFGDPRYDVAKLRHSACSHYDFIVSGLYTLEQTASSSFELTVHTSPVAESFPETFDELLADSGYDVRDIRFIESLLFLSMVPLHAESAGRQRALFLTGLRLLNDDLD